MWQGVDALAAESVCLKFVTLTLKPEPRETGGSMIDRLSNALTTFNRNIIHRHYKGARWARVFEAGTWNGRPHMHMITDADFPVIPRLRPGETRLQWEARLTPEAREFQARAVKAGFGPIMSVEVAKSEAGVAAYLAGYVAKNDRQLQRPDGRKLRLVGFSKNWPHERKQDLYRIGQVWAAPGETEDKPCPDCRLELDDAAAEKARTGSNARYGQVRERNIRHWLRPSMPDPTMRDTVEAMFVAMQEAANRDKPPPAPRTDRRRSPVLPDAWPDVDR